MMHDSLVITLLKSVKTFDVRCDNPSHRVCHGYRKTHRFSKMGSVGTGTVVDFSTPQHTVYPYCSIVGMYG
jgi:hypothetical protein